MTIYISNTIKTVIFLAVLAIGLGTSFAQDTRIFYTRILQQAGMDICDPLEQPCDGTFELVFSSELEEHSFVNNTLVVCDSDLVLPEFQCTPNKITSDSRDILLLDSQTSSEVYYYINDSDKNIVYSPESNLISVESVRVLSSFLQGFVSGTDSLTEAEEISLDQRGFINDVLDNPLLEVLYIGVFILGVYIVLKPLFAKLKGTRRKTKPSPFVIKTLQRVKDFSLQNRHYAIFALLLSALSYSYSLVFVSLKDTSKLDPRYLFTYVLSTVDFSNLPQHVASGNDVKLIYVFANILIILLTVLCFLPNIIDVILGFLNKIKKSKLNNGKLLIAFIVLLTLLNIGISSRPMAAFVVSAVIALAVLLKKDKARLSELKNKNLFFITSVVLVSVSSLFAYRSAMPTKASETTIVLEDNFGYLVLPINVELPSDAVFEDRRAFPTSTIFADNYLVYTPGYSLVNNYNIREFSSDALLGDYSLYFEKMSDFIWNLYNNPKIAELFVSNAPTSVLGFDGKSNSNYELELVLACPEKSYSNVTLNYHHQNINDNVTKQLRTINLAGCDEENLKTYSIRFALDRIPQDKVFISLSKLPENVVSIRLLADSEIVPVTFFKHPENGYFISKNIRGNSISHYALEIPGETSFNYDETSGENMFETINELISSGFLGKHMTLWSPDSNILQLEQKQ